jgi:hypothetical protein
MRFERGRIGFLPAALAAFGLAQMPADGRSIILHSALCGSARGANIALHIPLKSGRRRPDCPAGCHAACPGRRRSQGQGDTGDCADLPGF